VTRDDLEAIIRRQLTLAIAGATTSECGHTKACNDASAVILKAADEYGLAEFGIQAERRRALLAGTVGDGSYGGRAS